jgi:hypothetical protein
MFQPNMFCWIAPNTGRNLYGEDQPGMPVREGCAIVELKSAAQATNSRAQLSGSQTHAEDLAIIAELMLTAKSAAKLGDKLTVAGIELRIVGFTPQFNTSGVLDHYLVAGSPWV